MYLESVFRVKYGDQMLIKGSGEHAGSLCTFVKISEPNPKMLTVLLNSHGQEVDIHHSFVDLYSEVQQELDKRMSRGSRGLASALSRSGIKTIDDLRKTPIETLKELRTVGDVKLKILSEIKGCEYTPKKRVYDNRFYRFKEEELRIIGMMIAFGLDTFSVSTTNDREVAKSLLSELEICRALTKNKGEKANENN